MLALCFYGQAFIVAAQKKQLLKQAGVKNLTEGQKIITHNNFHGIIIRVYQHSVIIETSEGKKQEVYNYSIKSVIL